jgi:hypothetical protein
MKVLNEGDKPSFNLPKAPKVKLKPAPPDQRQIAVMPIKALTDRRLSGGCVRVLALICSYCNRAGITWVGQQRLAKDLQTTRQYISNQISVLRKAGYIETLVKGGKHSHTATTRVMIGMCAMTQQQFSRDLEIWLKARTSPPDSILDLARALLDEQCKGA